MSHLVALPQQKVKTARATGRRRIHRRPARASELLRRDGDEVGRVLVIGRTIPVAVELHPRESGAAA
jgi:hypothetical protein